MPLAHRLGLPYPGYLLVILRRTLLMWVLARIFVFVVLVFMTVASPGEAIRQPVLGAPALFVWLDRRFYHETLLPANLGTAPAWLWLIPLLLALGLDVVVALLLGLP